MHDVFFFTDIHGARSLFNAIMNFCNEQDPEAIIIFGGDAIDRGNDGYTIMKELLNNPKVIYLKGNHEDMFCKAAREIKQTLHFEMDNITRKEVRENIYWCRNFDYRYCHIQDSLYNGGIETLTDWVMDGMSLDIIEQIENLPLTFSYEKCDFCHSAGIYKTFKEAADAEYENKEVYMYTAESLMWTRTNLDMDWTPGRIAIFGHTPTPYLSDYIKFIPPENWNISPVMFNQKIPTAWKLDMDTGTIFTNRAYVLNVLTMKAQGFKIDKDQVKKIECIQF